ncbi:MAG TPA: glycosyltransferase family 2 protein [Micropepsaceae bacterium]|nr:glycosyltransferase family 2 protein [Micropepsaceae bacterium]
MGPSPASLGQVSPSETESRFVSQRLGERLVARGLLAPDAIAGVLERQTIWGCRFGEVLIADGAIKPIELAETLAEGLGLPFVDLIHEPPDERLVDGAHLDLYLARLLIPWRQLGGVTIIACADPSPDLYRLAARLYGPDARIAVTGKFDIIWTAQRLFRDRLNHDAVFRLDERAPEFSARHVATMLQKLLAAAVIGLLATGFVAAPAFAATLAILSVGLCYGANIVLRLLLFAAGGIGAGVGTRISPETVASLKDCDLPVYSILVPLYREAHMVARVIAALKVLDYPAAKLDIKLILEEDDFETIAAAKALDLDGRFEILKVPESLPRTKPRACNYALRFIRGAYVVIYDAEDRPETDQLKKAVAAFRTAPPDVAVFQARLNVYNAEDNWLTRMFALEYAAWFDFLLPGLERLGIPIPLGGTSNHFRAEILTSVCGWDAFNVTEDADLGVRLARRGHRVRTFDSSTYEEATPSLTGWIRQRSRWLKGYMQTALVHLRAPVEFARAVGLGPFSGFVVFVLGAVTTSLLAPVVWIVTLGLGMAGGYAQLGLYNAAVVGTSYFALIAGNGALTLLAMLAPLKRRWLRLVPYGAGVSLYWLLISAAAYKALWQLRTNPHHWEKTEHGLSGGARRSHAWRLALARSAPILGVLACFAAQIASANPWLKEKGDVELIQGVTVTKEQAGLAAGSVNSIIDVHLEYGAAANATLILDSDLQQQITADGRRTNFDNAWAGIRTVLNRSDYSVLSAELDAGVSGVRHSPLTPDIGLNGRAEARLMFGGGFDVFGRHGFAGVETGWRWRGGAPADEFLVDLGGGIEPWDGGLLMLQSFSIVSTGEARGAYRPYGLSKLQLSAAQRLVSSVWVQLGLVGAVAGADQGELGVVFGVWERF